MEEVRSPHVGSPVLSRHPSDDTIPSALRAGSPVVERTSSDEERRPPFKRHSTSGSSRISQLFPSLPDSVVVPTSEGPSSRRTSYHYPSAPPPEPLYQIPPAPAPPNFHEDTSYTSVPINFDGHHHSQAATPQRSATRRLLDQLGSRRSARSRGVNYNRLDDEESGMGRGRLKHVDEMDEIIGYDLSGFDGTPLRGLGTGDAGSSQRERDIDEAGFAAEYHRLEAQLGAGMTSILEVPFTQREGTQSQSCVPVAAQIRAEQTNTVVAVPEVVMDNNEPSGLDLESLEGRGLTRGLDQIQPSSTKSYYFPPDPDMPAWRPFSMGAPWLSVLVSIALVLAGLQEFLCQLSLRRVNADPQGGLVKFKKPQELTVLEYFTWKYAPVLFFVIYGIMWQMTDYEVKRLEAFYQLSKKTGATAAESLNMDYTTFLSWLVPLRALRHKHYAVVYASISTLVASGLVPILQSASVSVFPDKEERKENEWKSIRIEPAWSRAVTVCLVLVAVLGCVLIYEMRRKSGLLSDPKGIAGVAAMATRSHILTDFQGLDTASLDDIHKQLRHRRYILHRSSLWQGEYISNSHDKIEEHSTDPRPLMLRLRAGVAYITFIILFIITIPLLIFVEGATKVTETLPFFLTTLAIAIKLLWGTLNSDVRMLEPFLILSRRHAPPETLTLDYTGTNPLFLPIKAFLNKHYLVALVGIGAILTEVLTVCVSSFSVDGRRFLPGRGHNSSDSPDNVDETFKSFWISFGLVMGILSILVSIAVLVYTKRSHKFMPRQVGTMASILAFIYQSKMLITFVDTERFNSTRMTRHLEQQGKTYGLGWLRGRDGNTVCGIDEEELLANYVYKKNFGDAIIQPNQVGAWENW
ncbi:hypothetical protein M011DRAFT_461908 [Sporormia fimetaria CBS 119925]|uniref:Uncharacterized protein n=1 Tax=Sporormia fimetaria CBS 119925 TaxID=1340428 RepID=A0A6A6UXW0_9PLEO|nr:hypothetical protein M011DRAFT_461908 [Sporormia fimetaria CBS 119925]